MLKNVYQPVLIVDLKHFRSLYWNWVSSLNLNCNNPDGKQTFFSARIITLIVLWVGLYNSGCKFNDKNHNIYIINPKSVNRILLIMTLIAKINVKLTVVCKRKNLPSGRFFSKVSCCYFLFPFLSFCQLD